MRVLGLFATKLTTLNARPKTILSSIYCKTSNLGLWLSPWIRIYPFKGPYSEFFKTLKNQNLICSLQKKSKKKSEFDLLLTKSGLAKSKFYLLFTIAGMTESKFNLLLTKHCWQNFISCLQNNGWQNPKLS